MGPDGSLRGTVESPGMTTTAIIFGHENGVHRAQAYSLNPNCMGVFLLWAFTLTGRGRRALVAALPVWLRMRLRKSPVRGGVPACAGVGASFAWAGGRVGLPPPSPSASPSSASPASLSATASSKTQLTHCASLY